MRALLKISLMLALGACGDDNVVEGIPQPSAKPAPAAAPAPAASAAVPVDTDKRPLPMREFEEQDFTESETSRDPFRSYASMFVGQARTRSIVQRTVLAEKSALDELKLTAVISGAEQRALLVDPGGLGWIVNVGAYVGKPEIVNTGGPAGMEVAINWRVDRIREADLVFVREDVSHPEIPPATRVIALRPDESTP